MLRSATSPSPVPAVDPASDAVALTVREVEVLHLVVEGWTNPEIADRLVISPRTVQSHVASAMRKLGARSRTQLAVLALRRAVVPLLPPAPDDLAA